MCKRHENIDNKHMEQQIVSMLENVLNDESEDEVKTKEAIFDKNINDCKDNFISLDEKEFWPKAIKENQLAPKLYVNDMPFHRLKGTPSEKYKRKEKKYNTADPCYNQNTITLGGNKQRLMNGGYLGASLTQNISLNYRSNCNPLSFSTLEGLQYYNSNSSSLT